MEIARCRLAQINIARARAPLTDTVMRGFVSQLAEINAAAEQSEGCVWRLTGEGSAYLQAYDDPLIIVNMSVWETLEALKNYVYRSSHLGPLRNRSEWFTALDGPHVALWWIPADHTPSLEDAKQRLSVLHRHGPTPVAFTFQRAFPAMAFHPGELVSPSSTVNYDGRVLRLLSNPAGECGSNTAFTYHQLGRVLWALYGGGGIRDGSLCARVESDGCFAALYEHTNTLGELHQGFCRSVPEFLGNGEFRLHEKWQWLTHEGGGESLLTTTVSSL